MTDVEKLLEDELGKVGAAGGALGGGLFGAIGGGTGARFGARLIGNDRYEVTADVHMGIAQAVTLFTSAALRTGRVVSGATGEGTKSITAIVAAGFLKMNPAVVQIELTDGGADRSRLVIRGTAKEGLIKQRAGEGAVKRLLDAVNEVAPGSMTPTPPEGA
jgi:hypothetical protein